MSQTADSYEAKLLWAVADAFANSATFATLGGGLGRIVLCDSGNSPAPGAEWAAADGSTFAPFGVPAFVVVGSEPYDFSPSELGAPFQYDRTATIPCVLWVDVTSETTPRDQILLALNIAGAIRAEVEAHNTTFKLVCTTSLQQIPQPGDAAHGYMQVTFNVETGRFP